MTAETLYTFTAADLTSLLIACTACGHGIVIVIANLETFPRQPGALRCPGCDREWWIAGGPSTAYSPERRLIEALIEIRQRDHAPPATVKLLVSTERTRS